MKPQRAGWKIPHLLPRPAIIWAGWAILVPVAADIELIPFQFSHKLKIPRKLKSKYEITS
jgi:hypothetical protein